VNTKKHFKQNHPVHLALRDTYYQKAIELLQQFQKDSVMSPKIADYEKVLFLLRTARDHGNLSTYNQSASNKNGQFNQFINLLAGNVKSVLSMLNLKKSVEDSDGFFLSFLGINQASVALQAEEYERRTRDIISCMLSTLELSKSPYEKLVKDNLDHFSTLEHKRYKKAEVHYQSILKKDLSPPVYKKKITPFS